LNYQEHTILYRIMAKAQRDMLIHGCGETVEVCKNQIDFLKDNFLVTEPDLPGSGQSQMIDDI